MRQKWSGCTVTMSVGKLMQVERGDPQWSGRDLNFSIPQIISFRSILLLLKQNWTSNSKSFPGIFHDASLLGWLVDRRDAILVRGNQLTIEFGLRSQKQARHDAQITSAPFAFHWSQASHKMYFSMTLLYVRRPDRWQGGPDSINNTLVPRSCLDHTLRNTRVINTFRVDHFSFHVLDYLSNKKMAFVSQVPI